MTYWGIIGWVAIAITILGNVFDVGKFKSMIRQNKLATLCMTKYTLFDDVRTKNLKGTFDNTPHYVTAFGYMRVKYTKRKQFLFIKWNENTFVDKVMLRGINW